MEMPVFTIVYGILLVLLGGLAYFLSGAESFTALIPSFFGVIFLLIGGLTAKVIARKHLMHVAALFGLLAVLGTSSALVQLFPLIQGGEFERPLAIVSKSIMSLFSMGYLGLCIKSFVRARSAE